MVHNKYSQFGFASFLSLFVIVLLIGGIFVGVNLSSRSQNLKSKADNQSRKVGKSVSGEILVKYKSDSLDETKKEKVRQKVSGKLEGKIDKLKVEKIKIDETNKETLISSLKSDPDVEFAEPNYIAGNEMVPNDPTYSKQWNLPKVSAPQAWDIVTGSNIKVAVLDTGLDSNRSEFSGKILSGYDFINNDADPTDDNSHGTSVTGVIAAITNNNQEIAGIAFNSLIIPVKVLDSNGAGPYDKIASGIIYATDNGAKVINLSLSGPSYSATLENAVNYAYNKGVVVVAAAGNQNGPVNYPAAFKNVVAVAATDKNDAKASFSNYGPEIDIAAPGVEVYTTNAVLNSFGNGTSFASPHVAAAAALLFSKGPATNQAVMDALYSGAADIGASGWDEFFGNGRLNIYSSLNNLKLTESQATSYPTPTPGATVTPVNDVSLTPSSVSTDLTPPTITITSPVNNLKTPRKTYLDIQAKASDNIGIEKVEFKRNGTLICTDTIAEYSCRMFTTASRAQINIEALAYDKYGNTTSSKITITTF